MKAGDLIFVRGHSLISSLVSKLDGKYSHVAIAVSPTHLLEAQVFTKSRIVPMKYKDFEVVDLGLSDEDRDLIVHCGIQLTGIKYDYIQNVGYFLEKVLGFNKPNFLNSQNRLICSELVDILLFTIGKIEDQYIGDKTPNQLYKFIKEQLEEVC